MIFSKLYYLLTAYVPRKLPSDEWEYDDLKGILIKYFGLKQDDPKTWLTVAGHIQSTPTYKMTCSYGLLANVAKRLTVNKLAQEHKILETARLNALLQAKMEEEAKRMQEEADEAGEAPLTTEQVNDKLMSADIPGYTPRSEIGLGIEH